MKRFVIIILSAMFCSLAIPFNSVEVAADTAEPFIAGIAWNGDIILAEYNIQDFGAKGDGVSDDSTAIQDTIDTAALSGGGVIYFPAGVYRITKQIQVYGSSNITLRGQWAAPGTSELSATTIIAADYKYEDEEQNSLILISGGGHCIMDMAFWYPEQSAQSIKQYGWTIEASSNTHGLTVQNVTFYNSYMACNLVGSAQHIRNIYGTILSRGLVFDNNLEVSEIERVYIDNSVWICSGLSGAPTSESDQVALYNQTVNNAVGVEVGRADNPWLYDVQVNNSQYKTGIRLYDGGGDPTGTGGAGAGPVMNTGDTSISEEAVNYYHYITNFTDIDYTYVDQITGSDAYRYTFHDPGVPSNTTNLVDIRDYGAIGDGTTDCTQAIQDAMNAAYNIGGGTVVVPNGKYLVQGSLTVPSGVELRGMFDYEHNIQSLSRSFIVVKNTMSGALIRLSENSGIHGVAIGYPDLQPDSLGTYPATISVEGQNAWIEYVTFFNSYDGIQVLGEQADGLFIRGVWGYSLHTGIQLDQGVRNVTIENLMLTYGVWQGYLQKLGEGDKTGQAANVSMKQSTAFEMADCSNIQIYSYFCFGVNRGLNLSGSGTSGPNNVIIYRCGLDQPANSKDGSETVCLDAQGGDNITLIAMSTGTAESQIIAPESFTGSLKILGYTFWAGGTQAISAKNVEILDSERTNPPLEFRKATAGFLYIDPAVNALDNTNAVITSDTVSDAVVSNGSTSSGDTTGSVLTSAAASSAESGQTTSVTAAEQENASGEKVDIALILAVVLSLLAVVAVALCAAVIYKKRQSGSI